MLTTATPRHICKSRTFIRLCVICIDVSWKPDIGATDVGSYEPFWASWCRLMSPIRFCMRKTRGAVKYWWNIGNKSQRLWRNTRWFFISFFFSAFSKFRKATISFVVSVRRTFCLSAWRNLTPHLTDFMKYYIWELSENLFQYSMLMKINLQK